jgi:hypothetical protein
MLFVDVFAAIKSVMLKNLSKFVGKREAEYLSLMVFWPVDLPSDVQPNLFQDSQSKLHVM